MSFPIAATTALDLPLPATAAVDKLDEVIPEVTFKPSPTGSDMNAPDDTTSLPLQDELETEMTGVDALLAAELESESQTIENPQASQASQDIPPVFSQEPIPEDSTLPSSAISSHNHSQTYAHHPPTSQPQPQENRLRGGQLGLEIPSTTAGQKRTADGYLSHSSSSSSSRSSTPQNGDGPDPKRGKTHTRNVSTISTASSAMSPRELTNELKTRLSYAMVKVQKGWESLPIYDLESLASQSGSPSSSSGFTVNGNGRRTSAFGSAFTSPRVALARDQSNLSDPGKDTTMRDPPAVPDSVNGNQNGYSRTYESFWRSQAQRTLTSPSNAHALPHLAPPADVGSQPRPNGYLRRSPSKTGQLGMQRSGLSLSTTDLSTSSRFSSSSIPTLPHTPAPPPQKDELANRITTALINNPPTPASASASAQNGTPTTHTPIAQAQNPKTQSMQEQDAIETLLFMSSPGNQLLPPPSERSSQGNGPPQGSPLKTSFSNDSLSPHMNSQAQPRHTYHSNEPNLYHKLSKREEHRRMIERRRRSGGRLTSSEVEALIDSYKAESSEDEVELEIPSRPPMVGCIDVGGMGSTPDAPRQQVLTEQPWQRGGVGSRNSFHRSGREEGARDGLENAEREVQGGGGGRVSLPTGARSG